MVVRAKVSNTLKIPSLYIDVKIEYCIQCIQYSKIYTMNLNALVIIKKDVSNNKE